MSKVLRVIRSPESQPNPSRFYNSLDADIAGDFGYGWKLDLSNTKLEVKYPPGSQQTSFEGNLVPFRDGTRAWREEVRNSAV